jgi:hypothetical protein
MSNLITTTEKTTRTRDGTAVETVKTTESYPPGTSSIPPKVTTTTTVHEVDKK